MSGKAAELKFPREWEFRLVVDCGAADEVKAALQTLDAEEKAGFSVADGESSSGGKYRTLRVGCIVPSMDRARELAGRLGRIPGVKFMV